MPADGSILATYSSYVLPIYLLTMLSKVKPSSLSLFPVTTEKIAFRFVTASLAVYINEIKIKYETKNMSNTLKLNSLLYLTLF